MNGPSETAGGATAVASPAARVEALEKRYDATVALRDVTLTVERGGVHALVGENGAGKSTLLGVLAGRVAPTAGSVEVFGEPLVNGDPRASRRAGVVAIYQELTIVPALSACANVFLGQPLRRGLRLGEQAMRQRYDQLAARLNVDIPAKTEARTLSVADQQILEIMRALQAEARMILLDEPTASLAEAERQALYALVSELRADGVTMVLVSHNLDEVLANADVATVFRDGQVRSTAPTADWTKHRLVEQMLGEPLEPLVADGRPRVDHPGSTRRREVLRAEAIAVPGVLDDIGVQLDEGEILGIAGLVGSGRSTLLRALAGTQPGARGRLWIDGRSVPWPHTVRAGLRSGLALLPEDRAAEGLVLARSAMENVTLAAFGATARAGCVSGTRMHASAVAAARRVGFEPGRIRAPAAALSGGNQQKLLVARWLHRRPRVLLADEPTRGVDVGAKAEIVAMLRELASEGLSSIVVSSELDELLAISDRIVVLAGGRIAKEIDLGTDEVTGRDLLHAAFHIDHQEAAHAG